MYQPQQPIAPASEETSLVYRIPEADVISWLSAGNRYEHPTRGGNVRASLVYATATQNGDNLPVLELRFITIRDNP